MKSLLKDRHDFKSSKILKGLIPPKSVVESYFLYSGALEFSLAQSDRLVVAHTNKYPIYEFWHAVKHAPDRVAGLANSALPQIDDRLFYRLQEEWWSFNDPFYRAALFFILNRSSSLAMASCGERQKDGLTPMILSRLRTFNSENFYVILDKYEDVSANITNKVKSDFKLLLPGKYGFNLLGAKQERAHDFSPINHDRLFKKLQTLDEKWIVVYKFNQRALKHYKKYNIIMADEYGNHTNKEERCEELIIANF